MKKIVYISRINLSSTRTNVYNLAKTCEAINKQDGYSLALVTTDQDKDKQIFFEKMGVKNLFEVVCLKATDTQSKYSGKKWFELAMFFSANFKIFWYLFKKRRNFNVVYFRDESLFLSVFLIRFLLSKKVFFEIHSVYERPFRQLKNVLSAKFSHGIVAISSGLARHYNKLNKNIILSLCSAADDSWFDHEKSKTEFRTLLKLPQDAFIVGYTGVVGINPNNDFYEIDDVAKSLKKLPEDVYFVVVGEIGDNAQWLRKIVQESNLSERVIIRPWQDRHIIPHYLLAFDVNVVPKRKKDLVGDSPAKMFPPMASGTPIIAGRAECIEEVLTDGKDSIIVEENTPDGWAKAILSIYNDPETGKRIADGAHETKKKYTWEKRGEKLADFINSVA